jgi:hypothetical protein
MKRAALIVVQFVLGINLFLMRYAACRCLQSKSAWSTVNNNKIQLIYYSPKTCQNMVNIIAEKRLCPHRTATYFVFNTHAFNKNQIFERKGQKLVLF